MARRWKIALGVAVALLALRIALPTILVRVIEGQTSARLGRAVELQNIDLFLLAGRVTLEELLVGPPLDPEAAPGPIDPASALVHWPRVFVNVGWLGLVTGELRVERLEVAGARERLVLQADDRLEPLVVARPEDSEAPPETEEPLEPEPEQTGESPPSDESEQRGGWTLRLEQLVLSDHAFTLLDAADPSQPPVEFSLEELTVGDVLLAGGQISIGPVGVRGPRLRVLRELEIAAAPPPEREEAEASAARPEDVGEPAARAAPPDFRLASFAIEDAQFDLVLDEGVFEITLDLSVRDATLERDARFPVELRLGREEGWLEVVGDLGLVPVAFTGTVRWKDFGIVGLLAAASPEIPHALAAGSIAGDLKVELENVGAADPGRASIRGRVAGDRIELRHEAGLLEIDCEALEVLAEEIEVPLQSDEPPKLSLASIRVQEPRVKLVRPESAAGGAATEETPAPVEQPSSASGEPRIAIGKLEVEGGSFQLLDESVEPTATTTLTKIDLEGSDLRLPTRAGRLEADVRGLAGLSVKASGSWREGAGTTSIALQNLGLQRYNPYVSEAAGFEFTRGSLSLDAEIESAGQAHEVNADLTLENIALEDVEEGAFERLFGISAPMAVSLLTDVQGNIGLPVDLTLDEGEASIDFAAILIGAFRQSLGAVLAAPLKGLGLAVRVATGGAVGGSGPIELDPIGFEPGSAKLAPDQVDHLDLLANGLAARPDVGLELTGRTGGEDEPSLRAQALLERIEAGGFAPYDDEGRLERRLLRQGLERRAAGQPDELAPEEAAVLGEWLAEIEVSREARDRLARARADAVRSSIAKSADIDAAQLRTGEPQEGPPGVAIALFAVNP
jgi:hypothetical protein